MERDFPTAEVLNQQELKESQEEQINQLLGLIYALLSLAVIVSLFGIANTLALSIHERTRELGMLRAIGMSRRQVRTMIRYEAVITALIGAILGIGAGRDLRGADRAAAEGRGLHALLPGRDAGRAARLRRDRRRARRDRARPAAPRGSTSSKPSSTSSPPASAVPLPVNNAAKEQRSGLAVAE